MTARRELANKTPRRIHRRRIVLSAIAGVMALAVIGAGLGLRGATQPLTGKAGPADSSSWPVEPIWDGAPEQELKISLQETRVLNDQEWRTVNTI